MKVNIEDILAAQAIRAKINSLSPSEIEWYKGGKQIKLNQEVLKEWKYLGLSTVDFIHTGYYRKGELTWP